MAPLKRKGSRRNKPSGPFKLASGELDLMDLLWRQGPMTLAEAHHAFGVDRIGYTTMQTRLNRLADKGLALKSTGRPAVYSAGVDREDVRAGHLDDVMKKLADDSVVPLVAHLVRDRKIGPDELAELKRLVRQAERDLNEGNRREEKPS